MTTSWNDIPNAQFASTASMIVGSPIGLLLALTYSSSSSNVIDPWTKLATNTASWVNVAKAT